MDLDLNFIRSLLTLGLFVGFVTLMVLVIRKDKDSWQDAANLPFSDEDNSDKEGRVK